MYRKLKRYGKIVKATISYRDNTYVTDRTVYVDDAGIEFVKVNGDYVRLDVYKTKPEFRFHGYWEA